MDMARYKNEYAADLVRYFNGSCDFAADAANNENTAARNIKSTRAVGGSNTASGTPLPSFAEFARRCGVLISDIERWRGEHAEFARAYAEALECQRQLILQGVLDGRISPTAAKFYLDERRARPDNTDGASGFKITVSFEGEDDGDG